jgi:hypothetical protein
MTTPGQAPVASVAEAAERSHFALRRAVVDVAMGRHARTRTAQQPAVCHEHVHASQNGGARLAPQTSSYRIAVLATPAGISPWSSSPAHCPA